MIMTIATITALGFENKVKNNIHNMDNKKFDRLVAESTRSSLMESQRIDEGGLIKAGKNLWKGFQAARKGAQVAQGSRAANAGYKMARGMGFGRKAAQLDVNALKRGEELYKKAQSGAKLTAQEAREAQTISKYIAMQRNAGNLNTISGAGERLRMLQRNANRWRMGAGMGAAALAGYGLGGGSGNAPGAAMAGAGMDGTYPGTDMSGAGMDGMYPGGDMGGMYSGGMYPGGLYPGGDMGGTYPGWMYPGGDMGGMYPGGGYGDGFYDPDPNSLYAYMGGSPYGYGYDDMYGYGYGDPYGYGYGDPYGYGYGGAYDDGGMDPMMMYYMMNGGF